MLRHVAAAREREPEMSSLRNGPMLSDPGGCAEMMRLLREGGNASVGLGDYRAVLRQFPEPRIQRPAAPAGAARRR